MTGYRIVNLKLLVEELGEDAAKRILSGFSCPLNPDVEFFLSKKAIDFAKKWLGTNPSGFRLISGGMGACRVFCSRK